MKQNDYWRQCKWIAVLLAVVMAGCAVNGPPVMSPHRGPVDLRGPTRGRSFANETTRREKIVPNRPPSTGAVTNERNAAQPRLEAPRLSYETGELVQSSHLKIEDRMPGAESSVAIAALPQNRSSYSNVSAASFEEEKAVQVSRSMTLADFEELAVRNSPTISQAAAGVNKAVALQNQVGRFPNPTVGYFGSQIADAGTDQHGVFVEQQLVRGRKLAVNQQVMSHAIDGQSAEVEAQRLRVLTDVRIKFFAVLAAQRQLELTEEFSALAAKGVEIADRRKAALEGSQTELLQAQIQLNEIELAHRQAEIAFVSSFEELAAFAGIPDMQPERVNGDLNQAIEVLDWEAAYEELVASSPELQAAHARLREASTRICREQLQAIPNPTIQMGAGIDNATGSGLLNIQIGAPIPLFNGNEGNIGAARADYERAAQEVNRLELAIKSRLARVSREYDWALAAVQKYAQDVMPKAQEALALTEQAYVTGEFDFLQVFIVRRTYFESNLKFVQAQAELAQANARVQGMLLEGGLEAPTDLKNDDSIRDRVFTQQ